eukprot:13039263-Alexandrium_andersonii.AAC.1
MRHHVRGWRAISRAAVHGQEQMDKSAVSALTSSERFKRALSGFLRSLSGEATAPRTPRKAP